MAVATEDFVAISDHLGRYCLATDGNDPDGWVALWAEDGVFIGIGAGPIVGHAALREVLRKEWDAGLRMRHLIGNLHCDYQGGKNTVLARYYNLVTNWAQGASFRCMAQCQVLLVRNGDGWLIKRNDSSVRSQ
ncbi:MAG TPA: nuclear transport factor 2 family protein [Steroidobacteraceae bacterium]|jgi:hypothetical protein